ncbi:MAG: hypothetical protein ACE364_06965 [Chlorobiota bacterium]
MKKKLNKYLTDIIIIPILLLFFTIGLLVNIPGYGEFCDQDAGAISIILFIFISVSIIFLIRTIKELSKHKKSRLRKISLVVFVSLFVLCLGGLNKLIFIFWFGELKYQADSTKNKMIYIKLFENGKFFSEGYFTSCSEEITGTYKIDNGKLRLQFEKESEFISKKYKIKDSLLINYDEKKDTLILKNTINKN